MVTPCSESSTAWLISSNARNVLRNAHDIPLVGERIFGKGGLPEEMVVHFVTKCHSNHQVSHIGYQLDCGRAASNRALIQAPMRAMAASASGNAPAQIG
jgi:hypothetical protein